MSLKYLLKVLICILGLLGVLYYFGGGKKIVRRLKKRKEVYSNVSMEKVDDINKFIDILKNNKELEARRQSYKNGKICVFLIVFTVILGCIVLDIFNLFFVLVVIALVFAILSFSKIGYTKIYKNQVITSILKNYDKEICYMPENGIDRSVYSSAEFEKFDRYNSEDLIVGKICDLNFSLADVHIEDEKTDSEGRTTYTTIFFGPVAVIELNTLTDFVLHISDNQIKLFREKYFVESDNQVFEEKYDVFTNNDVVAMRILTPSLTTKILEMHNKFGLFCEIKLINGLVFFRFHCDTLFKPNPGDIEKEATEIAFYFNMLDGMKMIMKEIVTNLQGFEK